MRARQLTRIWWIGCLFLGIDWNSPAMARPAYVDSLKIDVGISSRITCDSCHSVGSEPRFSPDLSRPHNAFGAAIREAGNQIRASGRRDTLAARLDRVARSDADGDGAANLRELLLGRNPGRSADRPDRRDDQRYPTVVAGYLKVRREYRWRPFDPVPAVVPPAGPSWGRNPIDAFIAQRHRSLRLSPRPEAGRETLLRRVTLDLTGVPPTPEELDRFLADRRPDAYEREVDRLLASPRYGQRWGRHWMDVWRYSDWDGYGSEVRNSQPHIWRWRDWIVRSLNEDKGYDRMVVEMLAGDEVAPTDPNVLPATGFLVRNWYKFSRHETLNKTIEGIGKAFLGVTLNCARCHDHKYDSISQEDYFRFRAILEPHDIRTDRVVGQLDTSRDGLPRAYDADPTAKTVFFLQGDDRKPDPARVLPPGVPALLGGEYRVESVVLPLEAAVPDRRPWVITGQREALQKRLADNRSSEQGTAAAEAALAAFEAVLKVEALEDLGARQVDHPRHSEWSAAARACQAAQRRADLLQAEWETTVPGKKAADLKAAQERLTAARAASAAPPSTEYRARIGGRYPVTSSGRRLALARWLTSPQHPLTARVAANHLWARHFGRGLVSTVSDFGSHGARPSHPELLDYLAAQLVEHGWSMKHLHRLMVTSGTYRLDSSSDSDGERKDPENLALWKAPTRRLEAEAVRDSLLHVSGRLDFQEGGPELDPGAGLVNPRRSLYFRQSMEKVVPFLVTFDQAKVSECYERSASIVPQQALALSNSALAISEARVLAGRLWRRVSGTGPSPDVAFVRELFRAVLGRFPTAGELADCREFLLDQGTRLATPESLTRFTSGAPAPVSASSDPAARARESLTLVLFNHNDFVTLR